MVEGSGCACRICAMLRRAASNAYSWWWASHIRTNQSKWLENILREMDDRVKSMLKIIEEDADSFSRKAELYFQKRPELIKFVEETYRAYRALAERYDHISGELHRANHTIASAFPEEVQFDEQDEYDDHLPKSITSIDFNRLALDSEEIERSRVPEEIDKIQKKMLVLQTEKEFIRSSYETAVSRYEEIEKQIASMQDKLCLLQDDFGKSVEIEDDEARTIMAATALLSCEDTLLSLQENHRKSAEFTRMGSRKIMMAKEKLMSFEGDPVNNKIISEESEGLDSGGIDKEYDHRPFQVPAQITPDMSVVELAEKINELVDKVITLEVTTISQNAQMESLRAETDELHKHVERLEEEKLILIQGSGNVSDSLKQKKEGLQKIQDNKIATYESEADASACLDDSHRDASYDLEGLQYIQREEAYDSLPSREKGITLFDKEHPVSKYRETERIDDGRDASIAKKADVISVSSESELQYFPQHDSLSTLQSLLKEEDKGKIFLTQYTSFLSNYEQIKKRLFEVEQQNQAYVLKTTAQLVEMKKANDMKDEELRAMQQMLIKQFRNHNQNELEFSNKERNSSSLNDDPILSECKSVHRAFESLSDNKASPTTSHLEEKFRRDVDALLDENLNFWLRFSSSFQQIQKFQMEIDDLQAAFRRMNERISEEGSGRLSSDSDPFEKQLREIKTELQVWLEHSELLKGESQTRFRSLCDMQEEITEALASSLESDTFHLSTYQAAKFQGEVSNMQHENNKVAAELQAGLHHVKGLRKEVDKLLSELNKKFELSSHVIRHHNSPLRNFPSRTHIPLRNFLFGVKPKKKPSIFRCMNPAYQKQYSDLSSGFPSYAG